MMSDRDSTSPATHTPDGFSRYLGTAPKVLWVVSSGGHLAQAHRIEGMIGRNPESVWVTFDVPQSRSLLAGRRVEFAEYVAPRDLRRAFAASSLVSRIAGREQFDSVISTGAAIALVALPRMALRGTPTFYIESIARSTGPSLTGKAMALAPRVRTSAQYESWSSKRWPYHGSVLDELRSVPTAEQVSPRSFFVTLGTIRPYRFDRAVDAVLGMLEKGDSVVWQLGATTREGLPGESLGEVPGEEMARRIAAADVVITHAGVGSILNCLELGKVPVVVVRRQEHGEHVDDHQQGIADVMTARALAFEVDPAAPNRDLLVSAANLTVAVDHD